MKKLLKEIMSKSIGSGLLQNLGSVGKAVGLVTGGTPKQGGGKGQGSGGGCGSKGRRGSGGGDKGGRGMCGNQQIE